MLVQLLAQSLVPPQGETTREGTLLAQLEELLLVALLALQLKQMPRSRKDLNTLWRLRTEA